MNLNQFDYQLPEDLIAQYPVDNRTCSRLLQVGDGPNEYTELIFSNIASLLNPGDLLVVNDTRVIPARILARKPTGGKVEIMLERVLTDTEFLVQLKSNKSIRTGQTLIVDEKIELQVVGRENAFFVVRIISDVEAESLFTHYGSIPLPPYIDRQAKSVDDERYQTIYNKHIGAVAAPTAGLHFDEALLNQLEANGVLRTAITLHVGAGTYQPVRETTIENHSMHSERIIVSKETCELIQEVKRSGNRVIAIGTTVVRALESAAANGKLEAVDQDTSIFITPGYQFKIIDTLLTNFHLPRSTLLMLLSAFAGYEKTMQAYQHAITKRFRFYSYGDAMIVNRQN